MKYVLSVKTLQKFYLPYVLTQTNFFYILKRMEYEKWYWATLVRLQN